MKEFFSTKAVNKFHINFFFFFFFFLFSLSLSLSLFLTNTNSSPGALAVLAGRVFFNQPNLKLVLGAALAGFFALLFAWALAVGLGAVRWSDSAYSPLRCCVAGELARARRADEAAQAVEEFDDEEEALWEGLFFFFLFFFFFFFSFLKFFIKKQFLCLL